VSHAFTHRNGIIAKAVPGNYPFSFYSVSGTPADCVKFAVSELHRKVQFDVVFSGVNIGENAGVSAIYSGTVAGAREAALWHLPSIAISLQVRDDYTLSLALQWALETVRTESFRTMGVQSFWNVNFPLVHEGQYKGMRVAPMNLSMFTDHYLLRSGEWWLEGDKVEPDLVPDSDDCILAQGYASLTPMSLDQTASEEILKLQGLMLPHFDQQG
jgi:5'-nucleotidase